MATPLAVRLPYEHLGEGMNVSETPDSALSMLDEMGEVSPFSHRPLTSFEFSSRCQRSVSAVR